MLDFENIRKNTFRIGAFRVEPTRNLLKKDGQTFPLEPKIMDVLCELASYPGEVIARYDLIQRIWKVDYGADESLTRAVSVLRKTFRKGGISEKYIETISKNGYRLIAPVGIWEEDGSRVVTRTAKPSPVLAKPPEPILAQLAATLPMATSAASPEMPPAAPSKPLAAQPAPNPNKLTPILAVAASLLLACIVIVLIGGKGYIDGQSRAHEDNIAELRDLSKVDPGALDKIDPIAVKEPFRGEVSDARNDYGRSVGVMPFKDMSADGTKGYFADGIAEEIQLELSAIDGLRIVGRRASQNTMQGEMSHRNLGEILQVTHLVDGSVRTMNERVRVSAQLIDADSQTQIWGQSYDGALKDGLNLQVQIAADIVSELNILLVLNESETLEFNLEGFVLPSTLIQAE